MGRRVAGGIVVVLAALVVRVLWTREAPIYVGLPTQVLLLVAAPVMAAVGLWALVGRDAESADHHHGTRIWSLLLLPVVLFAFVAPQALGTYVVKSQGRPAGAPTAAASKSFAPLAGDPADVSVEDYWRRATEGGAATLQGRSLRIVGFATAPEQPGAAWTLARLRIWCCAADAMPFEVGVLGAERPADGQWVEVVGTYVAADAQRNAFLQVTAVRPITEPEDPYLR